MSFVFVFKYSQLDFFLFRGNYLPGVIFSGIDQYWYDLNTLSRHETETGHNPNGKARQTHTFYSIIRPRRKSDCEERRDDVFTMKNYSAPHFPERLSYRRVWYELLLCAGSWAKTREFANLFYYRTPHIRTYRVDSRWRARDEIITDRVDRSRSLFRPFPLPRAPRPPRVFFGILNEILTWTHSLVNSVSKKMKQTSQM